MAIPEAVNLIPRVAVLWKTACSAASAAAPDSAAILLTGAGGGRSGQPSRGAYTSLIRGRTWSNVAERRPRASGECSLGDHDRVILGAIGSTSMVGASFAGGLFLGIKIHRSELRVTADPNHDPRGGACSPNASGGITQASQHRSQCSVLHSASSESCDPTVARPTYRISDPELSKIPSRCSQSSARIYSNAMRRTATKTRSTQLQTDPRDTGLFGQTVYMECQSSITSRMISSGEVGDETGNGKVIQERQLAK